MTELAAKPPLLEFPDGGEGMHPGWALPGENELRRSVGGTTLHVINNPLDVVRTLARESNRLGIHELSIIHGHKGAVAGVSFQQASELDGAGRIVRFGGGLQSDGIHGHSEFKTPMMGIFGRKEIDRLQPKIDAKAYTNAARMLDRIMDQFGIFDIARYVTPTLTEITVALTGMSYEQVTKAFWHSANTTGALVRKEEDIETFFPNAWHNRNGQYRLTEAVVAEKLDKPDDGFMSRVVRRLGGLTIKGVKIGREEMMPEVATLINGLATTINPAIRGFIRLSRYPELIELARVKPELWTQIAYGCLKFDTFSNYVPRINNTGDDIQLPSRYIVPAGAVVLASTIAGTLGGFNLSQGLDDEERRLREMEYVLSPEHVGVAFGAGRHACTGQHLAIGTLAAMYTAVFARYDLTPGIPLEEMDWRGGVVPFPESPFLQALPKGSQQLSRRAMDRLQATVQRLNPINS